MKAGLGRMRDPEPTQIVSVTLQLFFFEDVGIIPSFSTIQARPRRRTIVASQDPSTLASLKNLILPSDQIRQRFWDLPIPIIRRTTEPIHMFH